jgi:hypothetical protein
LSEPPAESAGLPKVWAALATLSAALPLALVLRGFTVDDALVTARVASRLSLGQGYRFNPAGPEVDAVTPLGFAQLLALGGAGGPLAQLERARWLGLAAWLLSAIVLGCLLPRGRRALVTTLPVIALSAPLAAWASSGMETGVVTLAATLALFGGPAGALCAGLAAAWRPELLVFGAVLSAGQALALSQPAERARRFVIALGLAVGPAILIAVVRQRWFGSATPLSVLAKPSDLAHGFSYALTGFVLTGAPLLLLSPRALRASDRQTRVLLLAVVAHFGAVTAAGGDWMALYRLLVPVLPATLLAAARLSEGSATLWLGIRVTGAVLASLALLASRGLAARSVFEHRTRLITQAEPLLRDARSIAALDIGWVGAATNAPLLDLAGITDPMVARLSGGHTSKRITSGLLENRDVDTLVLLLAPGRTPSEPWTDSIFARDVENRLAASPVVAEFRVSNTLPLGGTQQLYLIVTRPTGRR